MFIPLVVKLENRQSRETRVSERERQTLRANTVVDADRPRGPGKARKDVLVLTILTIA